MSKFQSKIHATPGNAAVSIPFAYPPSDAIFDSLNARTAEPIEGRLCPKGLFVLFGAMGAASDHLSDWAESVGATMMVVGGHDLPLEWLRKYSPQLDFMMIDADYLGDTEETVDFCLRVRRAVPGLPLILLSSEVRAHDFTCERMMACDATLKHPLMRSALTMGVQAAYVNNEYYQRSRCC